MSTKIQAIHSDILVIADYFHEFCKKNGVKYFLLGGTALGAARHAGFIPWDDDFDVCMDYENYTKFQSAWISQGGSSNLTLQREGTAEWPLYFSKLRLNNSVYMEAEDTGRVMHNGVYIDIMCLNKLHKSKLLQRLQFLCAKVLTADAIFRRGYSRYSIKKLGLFIIATLLVGVFGRRIFLWLVRSKNSSERFEVYGHFFGRAPFAKSIIPKYVLGDGKLACFSGRQFYVFQELHEYLAVRFGSSYMEMPSEETKALFPSHCVEYVSWDGSRSPE